MKLLNKVSKFLENEDTIFSLREEIKKLKDELKYVHERYDDSIELNENEERRFQELLKKYETNFKIDYNKLNEYEVIIDCLKKNDLRVAELYLGKDTLKFYKEELEKVKKENSELREENELFKQFFEQLPDGFKLSWKLFKDLKGERDGRRQCL